MKALPGRLVCRVLKDNVRYFGYGKIRTIIHRRVSILEVDFLDAGADAGEDFVGNGVEDIGEDGDGQVVAKDLDHVALVDIRNVGDVYHGDIHTDVAHVRSLTAIDETVAGTTTQMAVQAVGIADGDGGNQTVARQYTLAAVAYGFVLGHTAQLKDSGLEG